MSNSYQTHKAQVEAARQGDGKFGSYESEESAATLSAEDLDSLKYEELEGLGDHLENTLDGDWHTMTADGFASVAQDSDGEPRFDITIDDDGRIDARFESGYHTDSEMLDDDGELEDFAKKAMAAHHAEREGSGGEADSTLNRAVDDLEADLPEGVSVQRETNEAGETNINIGQEREDGAYPMNIYGDGEGNYSFHAPPPDADSHNVHDAVGSVSTDDPEELAAYAADFYRDHVADADTHDSNGDQYGPFREVDRRDVEPGYDHGRGEASDLAAHMVHEQGITGYSRIGAEETQSHGFGSSRFTPHRVTLKNEAGDEVTFPHFRGAAYGDEPPTAAETIGSVVDDARSIEEYQTLDEFAENVGGVDPVDKFEDPDSWAEVKRDYQNIYENSEKLKSFVGDEAYEKLLWGGED